MNRTTTTMKLTKYILFAMTAILMVSCCDNDDSFSPGPASGLTKNSVFFSKDFKNVYYFYEKPADGDSIYIFVERADTAEALDKPLTLPLISNADTTLHIPDSIHFYAGESTTYIGIAAPALEQSKREDFTLSIPTEYADIYGDKEGSTTMSSSILWSEWVPVCDTVIIQSSYGLFPSQGCKLENFKGDNAFRFTNFLGSGNTFIFSLSNKADLEDLSNNSGSVTPLERAYYGSSLSSAIYDWSNDGDWAPWTPKGGTFEISYPEFGWGHYYYPTANPFDNLDFGIHNPVSIKFNGEPYVYDQDYYPNNVQMVYFYATDTKKSSWDYLYFMFCYKVTE